MEVLKLHNHNPDFGSTKAEKLLTDAKKRSIDEPHILPSVVTRDTFINADNETLVALPKESSIKAAIRRLRRRDNPRLPSSLSELVNLPEKHRSINVDQWLIRNSMTDNSRYLLFGCNTILTSMARSRL